MNVKMKSQERPSSNPYQLVSVLLASVLVFCFLSALPAVDALTYNGHWNASRTVLRKSDSDKSNNLNNIEAVNNCNSDRLAVYKVVLHTYWTRELFPKHYPDWRPPAQWSNTIGRTHDTTYNLFKVGHLASAAVKQFVETSRGDLLTETRQSSVFDEFVLPPINSGAGRSESQFFVDGNHSRVSLITRITPSPDWFVGMNSFQLCAGGSWIDSMTVEMDPLDAGTDNGFTFTAPNWPTEPQGVIYRITSTYPAHPASSFYYPESKRLPPIATYQFIKLKEYELSEVFNHGEDERRYETVAGTRTHLRSEQNQVEMNNELSANIEKERQHEMTPVPKLLSERDRIRAKLLARLNPNTTNVSSTHNSSSTAGGVSFQTAPRATTTAVTGGVPKNNKEALLSSIADNYKKTNHHNKRIISANKHKYRKIRPPRDCRVGQWSDWSACSKTCGIGEMHRLRKVVRHSKRGGRPCPPLQESKWCGSAKDCNPNYFQW